MAFLIRPSALALSALAALTGMASPSMAADMVLTPAAGSAAVIQSPAGAPAVRVQPNGDVQLPGITATSATGTTAVCHDANGTLIRCDASALAGTQGPAGPAGPAGPTGPQGPAGVAGVQGLKGDTWLVKATTEAAGANCVAGGQRLDIGKDSNANNLLDAGEVTSTSYACNGTQGVQGLQGLQGPKGDPGTGGVTGMSEVQHGCFNAAAAITSGSGYSVALATGVYTVSFSPAMGAGNYSLLLDGRTSTGRALALVSGGSPSTGVTLTPGWLDAGETIQRICFMLAR